MIKGIGTDIVEISRIQKMDLEKFATKILTKSETINHQPLTSNYLAKRFAAKEAIAKAYGTGIGSALSFQDIEISNDENGKPLAKIKRQNLKIHLSIADEKTHAVAFAIIED